MNKSLLASAVLLSAATNLVAQTQVVNVPLNYNFNGVVHAGENGNPDAPNGYRSISDRGLDWTQGPPGAWSNYQLVGQPGIVDIVHIGDRDQRWPFDSSQNGNNRGTQPAWLPNSDQRNGQSTVLSTALTVDASTKAKFIYMISDGGGSFEVEFKFASGGSVTGTLSGPDWFGGPYPGTDDFDNGNLPAAGLNIDEGVIDLGGSAGEVVTEIIFGNASNQGAGYAIFGCNFEYTTFVPPTGINRIKLNYNFNGIVHAGEDEQPDDPNGYRSISDRGLNFQGGTPTQTNGDFGEYRFVTEPGALDMVHLGNRNDRFAFEGSPGGNGNVGIAPNWLPSFDQTGPQTTVLDNPILMDASSQASVLFHVSDGGGAMNVQFNFSDGSNTVGTVSAGDWFGGPYPGADSIDRGRTPNAASLNIDEGTVNLAGEAGKTLTSISFQNRSNGNGGYAIFAMNVIGCAQCANTSAQVTNLGGGTGPSIATSSNGNLGKDLDWTVSGGSANAPGVWLIGVGNAQPPIPVSALLPFCQNGLIHVSAAELFTMGLDGNGEATFEVPFPAFYSQALCGFVVTGQHVSAGTLCPDLSDALSITIGN